MPPGHRRYAACSCGSTDKARRRGAHLQERGCCSTTAAATATATADMVQERWGSSGCTLLTAPPQLPCSSNSRLHDTAPTELASLASKDTHLGFPASRLPATNGISYSFQRANQHYFGSLFLHPPQQGKLDYMCASWAVVVGARLTVPLLLLLSLPLLPPLLQLSSCCCCHQSRLRKPWMQTRLPLKQCPPLHS